MSHEDNYFYDDLDDYDEADEALAKQVDEDAQLVWKIQCHELAHAMREHPLPGVPFSEEYRRRFHGQFPPFPAQPTGGELRNLFDEDAADNARECARSDIPDIAWFGAKYLFWRNEAIGRYCLNVNCLAELTEEGRRRGRPRWYCKDSCKDAAIKRKRYHEKHPNAAYRRPGSGRPDRNVAGTHYRSFTPPVTSYQAPWVDNGRPEQKAAPELGELTDHFRRWQSRHRKKRRAVTAQDRRTHLSANKKRQIKKLETFLGMRLDEFIGLAVSEGHIFNDEERAVFEDLLGESIHSLITGEDEHPDEDDGRPGTDALTIYGDQAE